MVPTGVQVPPVWVAQPPTASPAVSTGARPPAVGVARPPTPSASPVVPEPAAPADRLAAALDALDGVRASAGPAGVAVTFERGLFDRSDQVTADGRRLLASVGAVVGPDVDEVTVTGHAVATPGGPSGGGSMVALARALVAARDLAAASDLPITAFRLGSADQAAAPHADAGANRTVSLLVRA